MSEGKQKFKVGDRVRFLERYGPAREGDEAVVTGLWEQGVRVDVRGEPHSCFFERVALVEPASPIRTVTRREIVPGTYGIVEVGLLGVYGLPLFISTSCGYSAATDLREAAHLFNQLAEVLEENAASVRVAA